MQLKRTTGLICALESKLIFEGVAMEKIILNNKIEMPMIGFGTYQIPAKIAEKCVSEALKIGYRKIDTAQCYFNEREVGLAIKNSKIPREKIFVTTKLWGGHGYKDTLRSIEKSLQALNIGYIDLLLIHEPTGDFNEIYRAMETKYNEGTLRAIGVANFFKENFSRLMATTKIVPAINQIETHVFRQQQNMNRILKTVGTIHESWSPLACGKNNIFTNSTLTKIADAHKKTVAQIALRFLTQKNIPVIPKSTHIERMKENFSIFDFELSFEEMTEIEKLDEGRSLFNWW